MSEDIIRVLRVIEYIGPRSLVEAQVKNAIHGEKVIDRHGGRSYYGGEPKITIRAATVGSYPDILEMARGTKTYRFKDGEANESNAPKEVPSLCDLCGQLDTSDHRCPCR